MDDKHFLNHYEKTSRFATIKSWKKNELTSNKKLLLTFDWIMIKRIAIIQVTLSLVMKVFNFIRVSVVTVVTYSIYV